MILRNDLELDPLFPPSQTLRSQLTVSMKGCEDVGGQFLNMKRGDLGVIWRQMENKPRVLLLGSIDAINLPR